MNQHFKLKTCTLLSALIMLQTLCGCSSLFSDIDDPDPFCEIVDWYPASMYITVTDAAGNDRINPDSAYCVLDGMTVTYQGKSLEVRTDCWDDERNILLPYGHTSTRAIMPIWYGLCLMKKMPKREDGQWVIKETENYMLYLGEIDGARDMDEDITFTFADGQQHVIHYHCSNHKSTTCDRWYVVDGKKTESNMLKIILK